MVSPHPRPLSQRGRGEDREIIITDFPGLTPLSPFLGERGRGIEGNSLDCFIVI